MVSAETSSMVFRLWADEAVLIYQEARIKASIYWCCPKRVFHKAVFQRRLSKLHSHDCLESSQHSWALYALWGRFITTDKMHQMGGQRGIPGDLPLGCLFVTSIKWPRLPFSEGHTVMGVGMCWTGHWLSNLEQIIIFFRRKSI